ncbi:MAG: DEAD/DEAH box helicase, partial [Bacteroidota bacterium]
MNTLFVDVIIPLAIPRTLTYRVPQNLQEYVGVGKRVVVQLGKKKMYTAIIKEQHQTAPKDYQAKYIDGVLDEKAILGKHQLRFWNWMASYYCCTEGEVMGAALPASLKLASETKVVLQDDTSGLDESALSNKEHQIVDALMVHGEMDIKEISEILGQATVLPHVNRLVKKGWVTSFEEMKQKFKPKTEKRISLTSEYRSDESLELLVEQLESGRGTKKLEAVMGLLREVEDYTDSVGRKRLLEVTSVKSHTIRSLIDDGIFIQEEVQLDPFAIANNQGKEVALTEVQQVAFNGIVNGFQSKDVCLLHGVTGAGKTEIYIECIKEQLASGFQCLMLIPEIGLTTQLIQRLEAFFPGQLLVYHSKFNMRERTEVWNEVLGGSPKLVVG